jgi:hypothetical protein
MQCSITCTEALQHDYWRHSVNDDAITTLGTAYMPCKLTAAVQAVVHYCAVHVRKSLTHNAVALSVFLLCNDDTFTTIGCLCWWFSVGSKERLV